MENVKIEEIKTQIIKDRLKRIFSKNPKAIAKILTHLIKRQKSV
jgi:hypothetical protein